MRLSRLLKLPIDALRLATGAKSFVDNAVIGSLRLNERGLHRARCALAARMADWRRRRLARTIDPADRQAFDAQGFVIKPDFLPPAQFAALRREIMEREWEALEMRQGPTVTRRMLFDTASLARRAPHLAELLGDPRLTGLIRYGAATRGQPVFAVQTIVSDGVSGGHDPQTDTHADTFHATAKAWFFLHDVGPGDGPFFYVPGSHRRSPERLAWEHRQSLTAASHPVRYHARGSFRIDDADLASLGLPVPQPVTVRANTLVVADTSGFHGRTPSPHPTLRVEVYASLRRNPFLPWLGLDLRSLPLLRGHFGSLAFGGLKALRRLGIRGAWQPVGRVRASDAAAGDRGSPRPAVAQDEGP